MTKRLVLFLGLTLGAYAPGALAAVYYVDASSPSCSNSGPGTPSSPYCTISAAIAAHRGAGITILVSPGVYREVVTIPASGAAGNPFVIQATGAGVVLDGADDFTAPSKWVPSSGNVWRAASVNWSPLQVFADGRRLVKSSASPSSLPANSFRYVSGSGLYVNAGGGNPGTHQAFVGRRGSGFVASGRSWVTISGFEVTRMEDRAISLSSGSDNCVVSNNRVTFARLYGIGLSDAASALISGNYVADGADHGISLGSGSNAATIQDNETCRNADPSVRRANGIYLNRTNNCVVRRNRAHDNQDTGFQINTSSNNNLFVLNISWNNGDHGFDHLSSVGTMHRHDVAYGNYKDGFSIEGSASGTSLFNCIAVNNGLTTDEFNLWVDSGSASGFSSDYNLFWNSTSQTPVKYISTAYSSVASYSAATGKDPHTIQKNPNFVNPAVGDFHLLANSPAIDNATSTVSSWPATDAAGRARFDVPTVPNTGAGPVPYADRGALEFAPQVELGSPPVVTAPPSATGAEASPLAVTITVTDPEGDAIAILTADSPDLPAGNNASFLAGPGNTSGTWTWTPTYSDGRSTPYNVVFTASNLSSGSATTAITVTPVDRAPVVSAPAAASARAEHLFTMTALASDPDGDPLGALTADLTGLPAGNDAAFAAGAGNASGTLTWTPTIADVGSTPYTVIFTASNAMSGTASTAITVTDLDQAPSVTAPAAAAGAEQSPLVVSVSASDPDGDPLSSLTADLSALPAGNNAAFTAGPGNTAGTLSWTPATGDARALPYDVVFTASNALSATAGVSITIAAGPGPGGSNLVGNPSFESSTDGWNQNGSSVIQRIAGGFDGAWSLEMRGPSSGTSKFGVNDSPNWVVTTPAVGTVYRFTAWVRSAASSGQGMLRVREYVNGVLEGTALYSPAVTLTPSWQMVTVDRATTVAGSSLDLQIVDQPLVSGEVFQTDAISIQIVPGGAAAPRSPLQSSTAEDRLAPVLAPNPSSPDAMLAFTTSREGKVQVRIYDANGRLVRLLLDEARMPAGRHVVRFDGLGAAGQRLPSGIYFYRLDTQEGTTRGRIVRVR